MKENYTTVSHAATVEYEEKRSLFIACAIPCDSEEKAQSFVKEKKSEFQDATHNVWAYYMKDGVLARYSDDGEPQGTAGMPTLDAIRKSGADDVCVVVTRYFGGILLGAGGLVRAYSKSASMAVEAAGIVTFERWSEISLACNYSDYQKVSAEFPKFGAIVDSTEFGGEVSLRFAVVKSTAENILEKISEITAGRCLPKIVGERFDHS